MMYRCDIEVCATSWDVLVDHPGRPEDKTALCESHAEVVLEELGGEVRDE